MTPFFQIYFLLLFLDRPQATKFPISFPTPFSPSRHQPRCAFSSPPPTFSSASIPPTPVHHTPVRLPHLLHHFTICPTFSLFAPIREPLRHLTACAHSHCLCAYTTFANKSSGHFFAWSHSLDSTVIYLTRVAGETCHAEPIPLFAMKLARALAGRPIRALIGVIHLSRGKEVTNPV